MRVVAWDDGRVSTSASVAVPTAPTGAELRDRYLEAVRDLTHGIVGVNGNSVVLGPIDLLRFGKPRVSRNVVDWPIEGGLLVRRPGGHWRVQGGGGGGGGAPGGDEPRPPRPLSTLSHLPGHPPFSPLFLFRPRGGAALPRVASKTREQPLAARGGRA